MLLEWVNPLYLDISYQEQIQGNFEESSEIQLKDFLKVKPRCFCAALHVSTCSRGVFCGLTGEEVQRSEPSSAAQSDSVDEEGSPEQEVRRAALTVSLIATALIKHTNKMASFLGAMRWPLWVTCRSVCGNAGSCFIRRPFSCCSPTSPAFAYTTFVLTTMKAIKTTKNRRKGRKSWPAPRLEKPAGLWLNQERTRAEGKVGAIYIPAASVTVCSDSNLLVRAQHAGLLR